MIEAVLGILKILASFAATVVVSAPLTLISLSENSSLAV